MVHYLHVNGASRTMQNQTTDRGENVRLVEEISFKVQNTTSRPIYPTDKVPSQTIAFNEECNTALSAPRDTGLGAWRTLSAALLYNAILAGEGIFLPTASVPSLHLANSIVSRTS